jgi:competence protein ComEC
MPSVVTRLSWTAVARFLAAAVMLLVALPALAGEVMVDFLDVGQGDAILIRGGEKTVLIDASVKKARVSTQLRQLGVERLDLVVATHPHADHIGGMEKVVRAFDVGLYMDNGLPHTTATYESLMTAVEELGIPYRSARRDMTLRLGDEAVITVLSPTDTLFTGTRSDLNSNSVVLRLDHDEVSFLFMGDAEEPTEHAIASSLEPVDVLKVAHHGGAHSSTLSFVQAAQPTWAVISVGEGNRYKHPTIEAMVRIRSVGATIFRTDKSGQVRAISDGHQLEFMEGSLAELTGTAPPPQIAAAVTSTPVVSPVAAPGAAVAPVAAPPAASLNLSGVQPPNELYDDIDVRKQRRKDRKRRKKGDASEDMETSGAEANQPGG